MTEDNDPPRFIQRRHTDGRTLTVQIIKEILFWIAVNAISWSLIIGGYVLWHE